jgi:hypothetical protein
MERTEIENVSPEIEMLARMWIECDPNRMGSYVGSGFHPDDLSTLHVDGVAEEHPHWKWFIPRAKATQKYFAERNISLVAHAT